MSYLAVMGMWKLQFWTRIIRRLHFNSKAKCVEGNFWYLMSFSFALEITFIYTPNFWLRWRVNISGGNSWQCKFSSHYSRVHWCWQSLWDIRMEKKSDIFHLLVIENECLNKIIIALRILNITYEFCLLSQIFAWI